jgi:hypothetical protein
MRATTFGRPCADSWSSALKPHRDRRSLSSWAIAISPADSGERVGFLESTRTSARVSATASPRGISIAISCSWLLVSSLPAF